MNDRTLEKQLDAGCDKIKEGVATRRIHFFMEFKQGGAVRDDEQVLGNFVHHDGKRFVVSEPYQWEFSNGFEDVRFEAAGNAFRT